MRLVLDIHIYLWTLANDARFILTADHRLAAYSNLVVKV